MAEGDNANLGTLLTVAGALSFVSAMFSGFNFRMTMASNVLFIAGVYLILGARRFVRFLSDRKRLPGAVLYIIGVVLIIIGRSGWGGLIELVGMFAMFGGFLPRLMNILQKLPYIGKYFRFALPSFIHNQAPTETELPL